jgi:glycosyltransferase involved in cell wall biosynthesis
MRNNHTLVVFYASMRNIGLLYHFRYMSEAFDKLLVKHDQIKLLIVTENGEQIEGLRNELTSSIKNGEILDVENIDEVNNYISNCINNFDRIILLTQGNLQLLQACKMKVKYRKKINIYLRLNSFNHGKKIKRTLNSLFITALSVIFNVKINFQCGYTKKIFAGASILQVLNRSTVIPLGLNSEDLTKDYSDIEKKYVNIIYLAQFHKHKNHLLIIKKLSRLLNERHNLKLNFYGDGEYLNDCENYVKQHGLDRNIKFHGRIPREQIPDVINKADLSLVASKVETFGHNVLEPAWFGVPILTTKVGIAEDLLKDYRAGYLVKTDLSDIETSLIAMLGNLQKLKANAEQDKVIIRKKYNWDTVVASYIKEGII